MSTGPLPLSASSPQNSSSSPSDPISPASDHTFSSPIEILTPSNPVQSHLLTPQSMLNLLHWHIPWSLDPKQKVFGHFTVPMASFRGWTPLLQLLLLLLFSHHSLPPLPRCWKNHLPSLNPSNISSGASPCLTKSMPFFETKHGSLYLPLPLSPIIFSATSGSWKSKETLMVLLSFARHALLLKLKVTTSNLDLIIIRRLVL